MQTVLFEWKKMFIYQRGWLVILLALILKLGYLLVSDSPAYVEIELYRNDYMYYMENVKGELSEETINSIESSASQSVSAKDKISKTYLDLYAGNISEKQCDLTVGELTAISQRYKGMNALYEQYLYVRRQPENRYMIYPNGWAALLQDDGLDLFFVTAVLILIIQLFCKEYANKMDFLVMTTENGSKNFGVEKGMLALIIAVVLNLFFTIEHLIFCGVKYGLPHAEYPLQSLEYFSDCSYSVNLGQAFLILTFLRMFGAIFLAVLVCFMATWTRRHTVSCLLVLCIVLIPYVSFSDSLQYHLPIPLGFLRAVRYLTGREVMMDVVTGEKTIVFSPISESQFICLCVLVVFIIFVCGIYIWYKSRNKILGLRGKNYVLLLISFSSISLLTGCGDVDMLEKVTVPYNSTSADFYQYNDCLVKVKNNEENVEIYMQKEKDEVMNIIRSPFRTEFINKECIYSNNGIVYYMSSYTEHDSNIRLSGRKGKTTTYILGVSVDTMEEFCVFEVSYKKNSEWSFLNNVRAFFLNAQNIWFVTENTIWQVNLLTHKKEVLDIPLNGNIAYDGLGIYFIDDTMRLSYYDIKTGSINIIGDIAAGDYVLTKQGVYFSNLRDNHYIYLGGLDRNTTQIIAAEQVTSIEIEGDLLKYYSLGDMNVHTMKLTQSR